MLQKTRSKKGFTLAELLIVVAIIAVLTAIAVPLFVGSLNKAKEETFNSNQRAIKSMGVAILLTSESTDLDLTDTTKTYYAYAPVTKGDIGEVKVTNDKAAITSGFETYDGWADGDTIIATIKITDLGEYSKYTAPVPGPGAG